MKRTAQLLSETVYLHLEPVLFKELLRDVLFREAGRPYFKRLALPRHQRWLSAWRTFSTYQAERALLPVGGSEMDQLIRAFFSTHTTLRAEFQQGGMPVTAIRVLRQYCPPLNAALERVYCLECTSEDTTGYRVTVLGSATPPGFQEIVEKDVC